MHWGLIVFYIFVFASIFFLEYVVKRIFHLEKKRRHNNPYNKKQKTFRRRVFYGVIVLMILSVFETEDGPLLLVPTYVWMALLMLFDNGYHGYLVKKNDASSREYYIDYAYAIWVPLIIIALVQATKAVNG